MKQVEKLLNGAEKVEFTLGNVDYHKYEIIKLDMNDDGSDITYCLKDYILAGSIKIEDGHYNIEKVTNKYISVFTFLHKTKLKAKIAIEDINIINL